jgi:hypothetical protein
MPLQIGMNIRWDYFVNQYDTARYVSSADGRDNRHIQFVREFASVVSVLQVNRDLTTVWTCMLTIHLGQDQQCHRLV